MYVRDASLISDLAPLAVQDYEYLRYGNDRSIKDAFLAGDVLEPWLYYHDIDLERIDEQLGDVSALTAVVELFEDTLVRAPYLEKLRKIREKFELIRAARVGDDAAVLDASLRLYGDPQEDMFQYALDHVRRCLSRVAQEYGEHLLIQPLIEALKPAVAGQVQGIYPWSDIQLPTPRTYAREESLTSSDVLRLVYAAFEQYGITGWSAVVDAPGERMTFNTNHELATIFIPSDEDLSVRRYALSHERVEAIIAHEVGVHVRRRVEGEKSPLRLLGFGLAGYLRAEEGIATYAEQVRDGARHFAGILGYLSVGWARGIDGTPRTFRGLFDMLYPYLVLASLEHALAYDEKVVDVAKLCEKNKRRAWARCVRTFRGTTGATPGACFTKDIVYLEGNIAIWRLVQDDPTRVDTFHLGKYDPTNEEHVRLLRELEMLK
ncbi:MAG: DUF1704 domain-containing protein [Candidatus Pacebacteria bacterium]|nr:DUF1704 domain-containing protein [Candidatus Paceibacterota bacterium]